LETALPIVLTVLHHHFKLPLWRIIELLSVNPAKIFGLTGRGTLAKRFPRRYHHLRSQEEVDLRCLAVDVEVEEYPVRWMEFYGTSGGDDCGGNVVWEA